MALQNNIQKNYKNNRGHIQMSITRSEQKKLKAYLAIFLCGSIIGTGASNIIESYTNGLSNEIIVAVGVIGLIAVYYFMDL